MTVLLHPNTYNVRHRFHIFTLWHSHFIKRAETDIVVYLTVEDHIKEAQTTVLSEKRR
jgi:hypothetical protein